MGAAVAAAIPGIIGGVGSYFGAKAQGDAAEQAASEQAASSRYAADINKKISDANRIMQAQQFAQQFGLQQQGQQFGQEEAKARRAAYEKMLGTGVGQMGAGEQAISQLGIAAPKELQQMKQDILSGSAESLQQGVGQLQAGLAQQGIRGGQAATQLRRGIGEMGIGAQKDINQLLGNEAMQRQAQLMAYQQAKALGGQKATLTPATY